MPEPIETADGPWLAERARRDRDALAIVAERRELTFGELAGRVERLARRLAALGVTPGDRVATLLDSSLRTVEVIHAIERCNAILVPLNTRLTAEEIEALVVDTEPRLLVYDEAHRSRISPVDHVVPLLEATGELDTVRSDGSVPDRIDGDSMHTILFTSGTTGRPKGAMLRRAHHHASARASRRNLGDVPHDRWLGMLPLYHVAGLSILVRSVIDGVPLVLHSRFSPVEANTAIRTGGVTLVSVVSTMLVRMLDENGTVPYPNRLRAVLVGGGPVPPDLVERAQSVGMPVLPTYGLTETASQVVTCRPGEAASFPGTCGRPLPGTEIRLRDVDAEGRGEILVRGPTVMAGYLRLPDATRRALRGGWLHTGDVGRMDAAGRLEVCDRRTDLIVTGGENVYPVEVEAVLLAHPGVGDAAVYALPDPEWGQRVAAVVVPANDVDTESLRAFCEERLAPFKVPRSITFATEVPRTASGKIQRRRLRAVR